MGRVLKGDRGFTPRSVLCSSNPSSFTNVCKAIDASYTELYVELSTGLEHNLGVCPDALEIIADLYTNAVTRNKLDFAVTDLIELGRGTIQGDTQLPILFWTFVEPLLSHGHGCKQEDVGIEAEARLQSQARGHDSATAAQQPYRALWLGSAALPLCRQTKIPAQLPAKMRASAA